MGKVRHTWLIALLCALTMLGCVGCSVFPGVVTAGTSLPSDQYATGRETGISATVRDHATGEALQQRYSELARHWSVALEGKS